MFYDFKNHKHFYPTPNAIIVSNKPLNRLSGSELCGASLIGYDLLHVTWDIYPIIVFMMVFLYTRAEQ